MAEDLSLKADGELRRALDRRHLLFISMGEAAAASLAFAYLYAATGGLGRPDDAASGPTSP